MDEERKNDLKTGAGVSIGRHAPTLNYLEE